METKKENNNQKNIRTIRKNTMTSSITGCLYLCIAFTFFYFILGNYSSPDKNVKNVTEQKILLDLIIASVTLIISAASIIGSIAFRLYYRRKIAIEYLGWGIFATSIWNIINSDFSGFLFSSISTARNIALFTIILGPIPLLLFMDEIQKKRYQKAYNTMSILLLLEFAVFTLLHLAKLRSLTEDIPYIMLFYFLAIVLMLATLIADIKNNHIREYPFIAAGMAGIWLIAFYKILGYVIPEIKKSSSILPIGAIILLLIAVIHTIHEYIDMEQKKKQALLASEAKGRFLANMSHEIRTPINAVLGMDAMILRECNEPQIKEYALDIQNAGQSLLALINDILDLSKIESGKLEILPGEYDLSSLIHDIMNMITMKAADKNLAINLSIDEKLPSRLWGDDIRIRQVLVNLMNNAVKYTEKGSVTLTVSGTIKENTAVLTFQVEDTGIGIKEEDLDKLFAEFERIEERRNRNVEGTGLGMSITTQLLELMESKLQVESTYGKGSRFYFTLEQKIMDAEPVGDLEKRIRSQAANYTYHVTFTAPDANVLVVDDNAVNRKVFRNLLKATKIKIDEAAGGLECLKMTAEKHYDIIFLDHMMPDLDGIETLHRLKEDTSSPCGSTPVIALTANAVSGAKEMYLSEGFSSFLSKPINPEKLEKMLVENLPEHIVVYEEAKEVPNETNSKETTSLSSNLEELPEIDGIDWNYALLYTKDKEMLMSTVEDFYHLMDTEAEQLEHFSEMLQNQEEEETLRQYRVKVHSMKSSAAMIGGLSLSGVARMLENAAREGKTDVINNVTLPFLEEWRSMKERLKPYIKEETPDTEPSAKEADYKMTKEYLHLLGTAMETMDIDTADEIIKQLKKVSYPEPVRPVMEQLSLAVNNLDAEQTMQQIQELETIFHQMEENP